MIKIIKIIVHTSAEGFEYIDEYTYIIATYTHNTTRLRT